jgi:tRNA (guanine-N7-)-methyltransferase
VTSGDTVVPWGTVFGNQRPVEVEIGPGRGETLLAFAAAAAEVNFFAIERSGGAAAAITRRAAALGLANVRVVAGDARCIVARLVPAASVAAYHLYFPDPWPKRGHEGRRLLTGTLPDDLARSLVPGGTVHVATDLPALLEDFQRRLIAAGLRPVASADPPPRPRTSFERRYAAGGTHYARFSRPSQRRGYGAPAAVGDAD